MKPRQIKFVHDFITYIWDNVPEEKFNNWYRNSTAALDTMEFRGAGYPFMLQVEPTSLCNLSCTLCPTGRRELNRAYRNMTLNEFKPLIDDMERYLLFLVLWDWGEPLMNPELPSMIRYASERGIQTVTSTNAHYLNDEAYTEELLNSGLTTLIVAVDSVSADNYGVYRKCGDLDQVLGGLRRTVAIKKRIDSKTLINVRMVIMKQNEHEIADIERMARSAGADVFTVKSLNPSCGLVAKDEELLPANPQYRRYEYIPGTFERVRADAICRRVWTMSNIFSNGDVVPCCYDYDSEMKVGNVFETPFTQLWNSLAYRELRKRIYNDMQDIPKCIHCGVNFKLSEYGWFAKASDLRSGSGMAVPMDNQDFDVIKLTERRYDSSPEKLIDMQTSFSIIMPTYNRKSCIKKAIDSLLTQTYQNFELIVVDDGSTDGTGKYLKNNYKEEIVKRKIRYFRLAENKGAAFARNEGLKKAKYNWIGYLDTDNLMHNDFLETFVNSIENNINYDAFYAQIKHRQSQAIIGHPFDYDELVQFNYIDLGIFVHSVRIYKELGGFDIKLNRFSDMDLIIKYTYKYLPIFVEKILLDYDDDPVSLRISNNASFDEAYKRVILNYFKRISAPDFFKNYTDQAERFKRAIADRDAHIEEIALAISDRDAQIASLNQSVRARDSQIAALCRSTSWSITMPLRFIARLLRGQ